MENLIFYAYYIFIVFVVAFLFVVVGLIIYKRRNIIHFRILNENMDPVVNLNIYGISYTQGSQLGQTKSGEFVSVAGGNPTEHLKRIGKTNLNGEFKATYYMTNYGLLAFPIENEYNLPNQLLVSDLLLSGEGDKIKTILVKSNGRMVIKNPTRAQKLKIKKLK